MLAIELVEDRETKAAGDRSWPRASSTRRSRAGLLLLKAGVHGNCIRVLVPLVISDARARRGARRLGSRADGRALARAGRGLPSPPMVGEVLSDRYELEELVGTGGMSSVYRAHDRLLDRKVALKVLHEQYSQRRGVRRALPPRGAVGRDALASEHRHGDRPRRARAAASSSSSSTSTARTSSG